MFSIIIPLYNKSTHIEKCLQSVIDQAYREFEVIIVNDGSTDDSLEKINRFKVSKFQSLQIINQANAGVSTARNNGVKEAKCDYIAFLDADDWWEPNYLNEMKNLVYDFPEAGIYGSNYYLVKSGIRRIAKIGVEPSFSQGIINYCQVYAKTLTMPLWTCATVIHKRIFESENGFKPILRLGEDFDLWIRVALKYKVAFLNKPLSNYNQDVELENRAIGNLHNPKNHMLWNLEYLADEEKSNPDLKQLLDNLRVYDLFPYFLTKAYHKSAKLELEKVDWSKQPSSAKRKYNTPVIALIALSRLMTIGSKYKQEYLKLRTKYLK